MRQRSEFVRGHGSQGASDRLIQLGILSVLKPQRCELDYHIFVIIASRKRRCVLLLSPTNLTAVALPRREVGRSVR